MTPRILYIDNSTLSAAAECSTLDVVRYGLGWTSTGNQAPLKAGTAVHEALATYLRGGNAAEALYRLEAEYREWSESAGIRSDDRFHWLNVQAVVRRWLVSSPLDSLPWVCDPALVEVGAQAQLTDNGECLCGHAEAVHSRLPAFGRCGIDSCSCGMFTVVVLTARLDALPRDRAGRWWVHDWKTTWKIDDAWRTGFEIDSQMTGYYWLAQQHLGTEVAGISIGGIEMSRLPSDGNRKCRQHGVIYAECGPLHAKSVMFTVSRTPEAVEEWRRTAILLARQHQRRLAQVPTLGEVGRLRMEGTFNGTCRRCDLAPWCRSGRRLDLVDSMLVYSPWSPYERARPTPRPEPPAPRERGAMLDETGA